MRAVTIWVAALIGAIGIGVGIEAGIGTSNPAVAPGSLVGLPLADTLLVSPGWMGSCCSSTVATQSPVRVSVVNAATGRRSVIAPLPASEGVEMPWLAIGREVVALLYPPNGKPFTSVLQAYAFSPTSTAPARDLGAASWGILPAASGSAVWLENASGSGVTRCLTIEEVALNGAVLEHASPPCGFNVVEAVGSGLVIEQLTSARGPFPGTGQIELWDPATGQASWSLPVQSQPLLLGPSYMLYPAAGCNPSGCQDVVVTDLATGNEIRTTLAVPLSVGPFGEISATSNLQDAYAAVLFSPSAPADMAIVSGGTFRRHGTTVERYDVRAVSVLTGALVYDRSVALPVQQQSACDWTPCPGQTASLGTRFEGNPRFPYVTWSFGGGYLLVGTADHVAAIPISSEVAPVLSVAAQPGGLAVEEAHAADGSH